MKNTHFIAISVWKQFSQALDFKDILFSETYADNFPAWSGTSWTSSCPTIGRFAKQPKHCFTCLHALCNSIRPKICTKIGDTTFNGNGVGTFVYTFFLINPHLYRLRNLPKLPWFKSGQLPIDNTDGWSEHKNMTHMTIEVYA